MAAETHMKYTTFSVLGNLSNTKLIAQQRDDADEEMYYMNQLLYRHAKVMI
jgi:hypothetical protein